MKDAWVCLETPGGRRLPLGRRRRDMDAVSRALPYAALSLEFAEAQDATSQAIRIPLEFCCGEHEWDRVRALLLGDPPVAAPVAADCGLRCCCAAFAMQLCAFSHADGAHARVMHAVDAIIRGGYGAVLDASRARACGDPHDAERAAARSVLTLWQVCRREDVDASPLLCNEPPSEPYMRLDDAARAHFRVGSDPPETPRVLDGQDGPTARDPDCATSDAAAAAADRNENELVYRSFFRAWREPVLECPALWRRAMLDPFAFHPAYVPPAMPDVAPDARCVAAGHRSALAAGGRAAFLRRLRAHAGPFAPLAELPTGASGWVCAGGAVMRALLPCVPEDYDADDPSADEVHDVDLFVYGPQKSNRDAAYREAVAATWRCAEATGAQVYGVLKGSVATVYAEDSPVHAQVVLTDAPSPLRVLTKFDMDAVRCCSDGEGGALVTPDCLDALRSRTVFACSSDAIARYRVHKMVVRRGFGFQTLPWRIHAALEEAALEEAQLDGRRETRSAAQEGTPCDDILCGRERDDDGDADMGTRADGASSPTKRRRLGTPSLSAGGDTAAPHSTGSSQERREALVRLLVSSERNRRVMPTSSIPPYVNMDALYRAHNKADCVTPHLEVLLSAELRPVVWSVGYE